MNKNLTATIENADLDAELNALLNDAAPTIAVAAVAVADNASNDPVAELEEIEQAAVAEETRAAAYAEQSADEASPDPAVVTPISAAKKARTPRVAGSSPSSVLSAMPEEELRKVACLVATDVPDLIDPAPLLAKVDSLAKKVGDKALNLLRFNATGDKSKLQVFTRLGLEKLVEKGTITSKELTDHLMDVKYSQGTARSQANQLMTLLPALCVADVSGRTLTLRSDSTIVGRFVA